MNSIKNKNISFLLYGAYGYTGELIARRALQEGLHPLLAGRRKAPLESLAAELRLPYKVIDLDDTEGLIAALQEVNIVVHAAGPFRLTAEKMVAACIRTNTHYLDINGEIEVFEMLKGYSEKARNASIMIMPGVGFDVVPTDCMALLLKKLMPDATALKLAFATLGGGFSHGTAATMINSLGEKGAERKNGKILRVPLGKHGMWVDFGEKKLFVMSIPWGDVSTAYFTTGIPDIETFTAVSPATYQLLKFQPLFNWFLRSSFTRKWMKKQIDKRAGGPDEAQRLKAKGFVWGQVVNATGRKVTARQTGPEGYSLTAHYTTVIIKKLLAEEFQPGYQTPAAAYGEDLVLEVPGVRRNIVTPEER